MVVIPINYLLHFTKLALVINLAIYLFLFLEMFMIIPIFNYLRPSLGIYS